MPGTKSFPVYTSAISAPLGGHAAAGVAAGTNLIIPGVTGQTITVLYLFAMAAGGASTIQLASGTTSLSTPMTDAIPLSLASGYPQGFIADHHDNPLVLPVGQGLVVINTGSTLYGYLIYKQGV